MLLKKKKSISPLRCRFFSKIQMYLIIAIAIPYPSEHSINERYVLFSRGEISRSLVSASRFPRARARIDAENMYIHAAAYNSRRPRAHVYVCERACMAACILVQNGCYTTGTDTIWPHSALRRAVISAPSSLAKSFSPSTSLLLFPYYGPGTFF